MSPTRRSPEIPLLPDFCDDCPEQWLGFGSVEEEILRGAGLRLHKPDYRLTCDNMAYEMPIATGFEKKKKKKYYKRSDAIQTTPCSPRPCSPQICRHSPTPTVVCVGSGSCTGSTHHYWSKKCPLRIAELAQPKKRQCIENIKDNAHRLPPTMLERLRQRVNDDRPLAEIPDAINCFKIRRPAPRRPKSVNEWKNICSSIQRENLKRMEMRDLCAVFGHGLVTKLAIPMIISLNSELESLSAIVESDISEVMRCNKLICDTDANDCEKIRKEIADKVTAWIATVLEDAKMKLVDEDIQEPKKQTFRMTRCAGGDNIVTVIENQHIVSLNSSQAEMEYEIGPVLDFVDDLVNTVMGSVATDDDDTDSFTLALGSDIGGTIKSKYDTAGSDEDPEKIGKLDLEKIKPIASANDFYTKIPLKETETVEEDTENVIANNDSSNSVNGAGVDSKAVDIITEVGSAPDLTQQIDAETNVKPNEVKKYNIIGDDVTSSTFGAEVPSSAFVDNVIKEESRPNDIETNNPHDDNKIVGILHKEESMDNRTVKFSNVDMVKEEEAPEPNESIITFTKLLDFRYAPVKKRSVYDSYPLDSALAPPNENLLSQADESWPDDITSPGMTINTTITQSITSLGRIVESEQEMPDERERDKKLITEKDLFITDFNSLDESHNNFKYNEYKKNKLQTVRSDNKKLEYYDENKKENLLISEHEKNEPIKCNDYRSEKPLSAGSDSYTLQDDYNKHNVKTKVSVGLTFKEKEHENTAQHNDLEGFEKCKGDHKDVDREKSQTMESQQHYTPDKFEYRVNLETAPAWARIPLLATDDSCNCFTDVKRPKNETKDLEIKKWCKDLESAYEGLEQWSLWIKAACKEVIELKQKFQDIKKPCPHHYCRRRAKEWSRLKRDIDKDTVLWTKLYQRAHGTLKAYTEKQKQKINSTEQWYACTCRNTSKK